MVHDESLFRARRRVLGAGLGGVLSATLSGCGGGDGADPGTPAVAQEAPRPTRAWAAGVNTVPPQPTVGSLVDSLEHLSRRAELGAQHENPPWAELLAGVPPETLVLRDKLPVAQALRRRGLKLYVMLDPTNGLSRSDEAPALSDAGRSLREPFVQQLFADYAAAVVRLLQPDYLGLAAETNLVRAVAPASLYGAVVAAAHKASIQSRSSGFRGRLLASVQVETAWGKLAGDGRFVGIATDLLDFSFADMLAMSSYPQFAFADPDLIPTDYYQRLLPRADMPVFVSESGWASEATAVGSSSPALQARFIARHADLLETVRAEAWVQIFFADLDLAQWRVDDAQNVRTFASMGLAATDFSPKPALLAWDGLFSRPRRNG